MKQFRNAMAVILALPIVLAVDLAFAQKSGQITYQGDNEKTIARRAQWIEGAKKEGTLIWWGDTRPQRREQDHCRVQ